ncbi:MAG: hypothetical protein ACFB2X_27720 [Rivularia sp. (in: cyanobacteria)]
MRKNWKPSQSCQNIRSGGVWLRKILKQNLQSAYKLTSIALWLVVLGISGCNSSSNAQSSESD